ncbi:hypothetical protein B0H17DRAFT_1201220 [Mycena rosella]|uniref:Uncharacterized protein n=1 Tax=Mycena rosella TaxID=1033263 RepID=A0AAD7DI28_MYCRO|nr:hypothetical protein B0H17DRAFT_1201220 [Mycena rosella]
MDELERLCSGTPFTRAHFNEPSRIPHIVSSLDPLLHARLPKTFFDWFGIPATDTSKRAPGTQSYSPSPSTEAGKNVPMHSLAPLAVRKLPSARISPFIEPRHLEARGKCAQVAVIANGRRVPELRAGVHFSMTSSGRARSCADEMADTPVGGMQPRAPPPVLPSSKSPAPALVNDGGSVDLGGLEAKLCVQAELSPSTEHTVLLTTRNLAEEETAIARSALAPRIAKAELRTGSLLSTSCPGSHSQGRHCCPLARGLKFPAPAVVDETAVELGGREESRRQLGLPDLEMRTWEKSTRAVDPPSPAPPDNMRASAPVLTSKSIRSCRSKLSQSIQRRTPLH